jgi:cell division septation protein DedD
VIFLCGVLVGRGVRAERGSVIESLVGEVSPAGAAGTDTSAPPADPSSAPTASGAEPPAVEDLSYFSRLEQPNLPAEDLKPASTSSQPAAEPPRIALPPEPPRPAPEQEDPRPPALSTDTVATAAEPPPVSTASTASPDVRSGFAVQVAALNSRDDAEVMARRLSTKGYDAYVLSPAAGTPAVYRVRVGTFNTRREADTMAARLQREEKFKPWVTR